jgi:demethylmenaquinone methyltransferase / 2-methoxy-6-polyprenyl-1,4-benzoquinol methylase
MTLKETEKDAEKAMDSSRIAAPAHGASPAGIATEEAASRWVRGMFGKIAGHYDLLNHLLSFNLDKRWRARTVERVAEILARPNARVLDLCCGTADILLALEARAAATAHPQILGSDFCHPMLVEARRKIEARKLRSPLFEADALALPLASNSLDLITVAFGFRNLANYRQGLVELARVLKPGGTLAILEFSQPTNPVFASVYGFFSTRVLPRVGGMISGSAEAYSYLPESIRKFPGAEDLAAQIRAAGFAHAEFERMTFGAVALHLARK